jgi:hypothetical protein
MRLQWSKFESRRPQLASCDDSDQDPGTPMNRTRELNRLPPNTESPVDTSSPTPSQEHPLRSWVHKALVFLFQRHLSGGDIAIVGAVFVIGALTGSVIIIDLGPGSFYQAQFAPAISLVCGGGFHARVIQDPHLLHFLNSTSGSFSCPRSPATLGPITQLNVFAREERYLMYAVAFLWKLFGISWTAIYPFFALLYGIASAAVYWISRNFVARLAALSVAAAFAASPIQEEMLPQLRDYSAAPFMLVAIVVIVTVIWKQLSPKMLIMLAALVGLELGIGFGFRTDMLSALPPFLAILLLTIPLRSAGAWKSTLIAAMACVATFILAAFMILPTYLFDGSNSTFWAVEGNTTPFTTALRLQPQVLYDSGYEYNDDYTTGIVNAYAHLIEGTHTDIQLATHLNDKVALSYYLSVVRKTPGDVVTRGIAAAAGTLDLGPYGLSEPQRPTAIAGVASAGRDILGFLQRLPLSFAVVPGLAALILLWRDRWRGLLWILVVGYFGVINELQFSSRHNFYLEVFWWLSCAIVVESTVRTLNSIWKSRSLEPVSPRQDLKRLGIIVAIPLAGVILATSVLAVARLHQDGSLKTLFTSYQQSPRTRLHLKRSSVGEGTVLLSPEKGQQVWRGGPIYKEAFLAAKFGGPGCDFANITPILKYRSVDAYDDFSTTVPLSFDQTNLTVTKYFIALSSPSSRFSGIELPSNQAPCLDSLDVVTRTRRLATLLDVTLPTHWQTARRYQAFNFEPSASLFANATQVYGDASSGLPSALKNADVHWQAESQLSGDFTLTQGGWNYSGAPVTSAAYIAVANKVKLVGGSRLIIEGNLKSGGTTFGLQEDNRWVTNVAVTGVGHYAVVLDVPHSATYALVGTANSSGKISLDVTKVTVLPSANLESE